jgi:hypothetical protein
MAKNTIGLWLFLGLIMMCSASLDAAMVSATDEDALVDGVEFAEEWLPQIPRVEAVNVDGVIYYFYDPSFIDCNDVVNVLAYDEKDASRPHFEDDVVGHALTYLEGWYKGWAPFKKTLCSLATNVKRCFDSNKRSTWSSREQQGFVVIDVTECALSSYQLLVNDICKQLGMKPLVDEKEARYVALEPILELYNYFVKGGYTIVFVSNLQECARNRAWVADCLKINGYKTVHRLYLYPEDCKDSVAEYRAKIRYALAETGSVVAIISSECSNIQGEDLGCCVVWAPSPFSTDVGDTSFYAKLHELAVTSAEASATTSVSVGINSTDLAQAVAVAASSQSSSGISVASQSSGSMSVASAASVSASASLSAGALTVVANLPVS